MLQSSQLDTGSAVVRCRCLICQLKTGEGKIGILRCEVDLSISDDRVSKAITTVASLDSCSSLQKRPSQFTTRQSLPDSGQTTTYDGVRWRT